MKPVRAPPSDREEEIYLGGAEESDGLHLPPMQTARPPRARRKTHSRRYPLSAASALRTARAPTQTLEPTMSKAATTGCRQPAAASAMPARL